MSSTKGFVFRNVWPSVKQQSANIAHEQSSSFVRKSSGKNERGASLRRNIRTSASQTAPSTAPAPQQQQQKAEAVFPSRGSAFRQQRTRFGHGPRHVASDFFRAQASFKQAKAFSSLAVQRVQEETFEPLSTVVPKDDRSRSGVSIDELMRIASEKYKLNADFWGKYTDIPSMAQATDKEDVLQIIENFALIHRKHVYLFQHLKNTVMKNLPLWSAPDLAVLCHAWAQLGFLHEDLLVAMSDRVTATASACTAQELCWLMDAYATARCSVRSVTQEISVHTLETLDEFTIQQLCLHASSFARLNVHNEEFFRAMAKKLMEKHEGQQFTARDLTLAAYSCAKLGFFFPEIFETIAVNAQEVIRDFTSRDLQMLIVAFARAQYHSSELLLAVSLQAQRRMAQFSAESLTLMLRSLAFFDVKDSGLFTRAVAQLPRMIPSFRPADVTTLLGAFAAVQVHSESLFDVVTPFILEKAPMLTPADWISALRSYSSLGHRDTMFLCAMKWHLEASKLSLRQISAALQDCSRLSFSGHSESFALAAASKLKDEGDGLAACPPEALAQMYSSLLLLGHTAQVPAESSADCAAVPGLLQDLSHRLSSRGFCDELSPAARVSLCYATLLAPPVHTRSGHPITTAVLKRSCLAESGKLAAEERGLLRHILLASRLMPWNRSALGKEEHGLIPAESDATANSEQSSPFMHSALAHLAPLSGEIGTGAGAESDAIAVSEGFVARSRGAKLRGIFVAHELQKGLEEISDALSAINIDNRIVAGLDGEVHVLVPENVVRPSASASERQIALVWGSSVHYVSALEENGTEETEPRLSLSAKFQLAVLRAKGMDVIIVPHWWWRRNDTTEVAGRRLVDLLAEGKEPRQPPGLWSAPAMRRIE